MAEKLFGPVLLMTAFFGCVVLLIVQIMPVVNSSVNSGRGTTESLIDEVFSELEFQACEPDPFVVTHDFVQSSYRFPDEQEFDLIGGSDHPLATVLVRNATWPSTHNGESDYWYLWQNYGWLGWDTAETIVTLDQIADAYNPDTNMSTIIVSLRYTWLLVFYVIDGYLPDLLEYNSYNLSVGMAWNDTMDSISPWTMLGKIMSFRMPGTTFVLNALIAVPIYTALIYMAFVIIRSCIPLLGG